MRGFRLIILLSVGLFVMVGAKLNAQTGTVVVAPEKMNVLYIGVKNPIAVAVTGFRSDVVTPHLRGVNGTLDPRGESKYYVRIGKTDPGTAQIDVTVTLPNGRQRSMGTQEFRIKRVPDPVPTVGGMREGKVPASTFKAQKGVVVALRDFVYDLNFDVKSFSMTYIPKRGDALMTSTKGSTFGARMVRFLRQAKPGDRFFFDGIKVRGPSGRTRKLPSISYELT